MKYIYRIIFIYVYLQFHILITPSLPLYPQVYLIINIKYNFTYVELFMLSEMYG